MLESLNEISLRALIKVAFVPFMFASYVVFPIWLLIPDRLLSTVFVFLTIFVIPFLAWIIIDTLIPDRSVTISIPSLIRNNKENFVYFIGTFIVFWLIFLPLLNSPLVPRGDEPAHVARTIYTSFFLAFRGRFDPLATGVGIIGTLVGLLILFLLFTTPGEIGIIRKVVSFLKSKRMQTVLLFGLGAICAGVAYLISTWPVNTTYVGRFGPLQPLLFSLPHLLLGYSDATVLAWRTINLLLMVITAAVIRATTLDILKHFAPNENADSRLFRLVSSLAGWMFLLFPPTVEFSVQIWLTAGVALFFVLSLFFLVRVLAADQSSTRNIYFVLLAISLGVGSLWKRVILIEAGAIFVFLFLYFGLRTSQHKKKDILASILSGIIYACIFLPWFIVVQIGGVVDRPVPLNFEYLFPPGLWDYVIRFDSQMGVVFGILAYSCISLVFVFSLLKKKGYTLCILPIYITWYLFFNLDDGWTHDVDRFFIPALSLMAISICVAFGVAASYFLDHFVKGRNTGVSGLESKSRHLNRKNKQVLPMLVLIIIASTMCIGFVENTSKLPEFVQNNLDNRYIPYDPAAEYIHEIIQGNQSQLYSRFGPSSMSFYMNKYGSYSLTSAGYGATWAPDPTNVTTAAFVDYLSENGYRVLALPTPGLISASNLPGFVAQDLIDSPESYGIHSLREFTLGEKAFYVWVLNS